MTPKYFNTEIRNKVQQHAETLGLKGKQAFDVIVLTKNAIIEELQTELNRGQYQPVLDFLRTHGLKVGKGILYDKIIQRVVGRLMLRLGLPGGLALTIATLLVPILLKKISKKALESGKIQDLFTSLGLRDRLQTLPILKNLLQAKFKGPEAA